MVASIGRDYLLARKMVGRMPTLRMEGSDGI